MSDEGLGKNWWGGHGSGFNQNTLYASKKSSKDKKLKRLTKI